MRKRGEALASDRAQGGWDRGRVCRSRLNGARDRDVVTSSTETTCGWRKKTISDRLSSIQQLRAVHPKLPDLQKKGKNKIDTTDEYMLPCIIISRL